MSEYDSLRTLSFRLAADAGPLMHHCYVLRIPVTWIAPLRRLQSAGRSRPAEQMRFPVATLNSALRALVPDLTSIDKDAGIARDGGSKPWLYASRPIELPAICMIVKAWAQREFQQADKQLVDQTLQSIDPADVSWEEAGFDVSSWTTSPNGTALPHSNDTFHLWPDLIAAQLGDKSVTIRFGSHDLRFRRVPQEPGSNASELISWPPLWSETKHAQWPYSILVTFSVQTVPFQPWPVIHCDLGVRRWAMDSGMASVRMPRGETSVYLLTNLRWLESQTLYNSFQVAGLKWQRSKEDSSKFDPVWSDHLEEILDMLHRPNHPFPKPTNLLHNPGQYIESASGTDVAVVYRNGMLPAHSVGSGLTPRDRRALVESIAEFLRPSLDFSDPPVRHKYKPGRPKPSPFLQKTDSDDQQDELASARRQSISAAIGKELHLEIWFQSSTVASALSEAICTKLGLTPQTSNPSVWNTPELTITVSRHPLGELGKELALSKTEQRSGEHLWQSMLERATFIKQRIPDIPHLAGALIELDGADSFERSTDPKRSIRWGFARAGRLSQFIDSNSKSDLNQRANAAFLDLLRQFGVQPSPPRIVLPGLPEPIHYVGLWMIKHNAWLRYKFGTKYLPVFVLMSTDDTQIRAIYPGQEQWLPYSQALLSLADGKVERDEQPKDALPVMCQMLEREILTLGNVVLFCHAQNLRRAWPWLANGKLTLDKLQLTDGMWRTNSQWPGLRVVRIRDSSGHETPEWYAQNGTVQGFSKGLFVVSERVFASTHDRPMQFKNRSRNSTKLTNPDYAWNPGLFEIAVPFIQPGDEPWQWAALAHELRRMTLNFPDATAKPLPLHLAERMDEYVFTAPE